MRLERDLWLTQAYLTQHHVTPTLKNGETKSKGFSRSVRDRWSPRRYFARETSSGRFIPEMDGLRFIAIGMVVLFHLNAYLMEKTNFYEKGTSHSWSCRFALQGFHGVELFFIISGFILALPFAAHRLKGTPSVALRKYYLRRLTRLEPPYFIAMLLVFGLTASIKPGYISFGYTHLIASLLYIHNLIYGAGNGVAWSLEIEVQFYLLVPLLTLIFAIRSAYFRRSLLVMLALLGAGARGMFLGSRLHLSIMTYLHFFLIGFLLADIFLTEWDSTPSQTLYWDAVGVCGWALLFYLLQQPSLSYWLFPWLALAVYCAAFRGSISRQFFSNQWITAIGGMCYSIYLIHYEVISAVGRFTKMVGSGLSSFLYLTVQLALIGAAIVMVCGTYFALVEKPCMKKDWPQRLFLYLKLKIPGRRRSGVSQPFAA